MGRFINIGAEVEFGDFLPGLAPDMILPVGGKMGGRGDSASSWHLHGGPWTYPSLWADFLFLIAIRASGWMVFVPVRLRLPPPRLRPPKTVRLAWGWADPLTNPLVCIGLLREPALALTLFRFQNAASWDGQGTSGCTCGPSSTDFTG